jgi:hypothetical protein
MIYYGVSARCPPGRIYIAAILKNHFEIVSVNSFCEIKMVSACQSCKLRLHLGANLFHETSVLSTGIANENTLVLLQ